MIELSVANLTSIGEKVICLFNITFFSCITTMLYFLHQEFFIFVLTSIHQFICFLLLLFPKINNYIVQIRIFNILGLVISDIAIFAFLLPIMKNKLGLLIFDLIVSLLIRTISLALLYPKYINSYFIINFYSIFHILFYTYGLFEIWSSNFIENGELIVHVAALAYSVYITQFIFTVIFCRLMKFF